jgi:hypothetical protein
MHRSNKIVFIIALCLITFGGQSAPTKADLYKSSEEQIQTDVGSGSTPFWVEHFKYDLRILAYGLYQVPAASTQNPGNQFLELPRYKNDLEVRPDLRLDFEPLELSAKPRARFEYQAWQEGDRSGESDWNDNWFINEWLARVKLNEKLFLSYGRENLQWGPSFLFSPSNPFFSDNGKRNPKQEVPGMDFGRLIWIPEQAWTISIIANTDEGQNETINEDPFKKTYALKIDYSGRECYSSFIFSHREDSRNALGFFGGWIVSDALLLYGEGAMTRGSSALYPKEDANPFGFTMQQSPEDDSDWSPIFLAGGSYTFKNNGTLAIEYAYNSPGYGDKDAERYYQLQRRAAESLSCAGPLSGLSRRTLAQTADSGLRLLRKNYLLLQYNQNDIKNVFDLTLRWTQNLDDGSYQFILIGTYALGDHMDLFAIGNVNGGHKDSEFRSFLDRQWMLGLEYTF